MTGQDVARPRFGPAAMRMTCWSAWSTLVGVVMATIGLLVVVPVTVVRDGETERLYWLLGLPYVAYGAWRARTVALEYVIDGDRIVFVLPRGQVEARAASVREIVLPGHWALGAVSYDGGWVRLERAMYRLRAQSGY